MMRLLCWVWRSLCDRQRHAQSRQLVAAMREREQRVNGEIEALKRRRATGNPLGDRMGNRYGRGGD